MQIQNNWFRLLSLLAVALFAGCLSDGNMHGGDDFPNSVEPLGKQTASEAADSSEWNAYDEAPSAAPGVYDSSSVPENPPSESSQAPKSGARWFVPSLNVSVGVEIAAEVREVVTEAEPLSGLLRAVRKQVASGGNFTAVDTTWYTVQGSGFRLKRVSGTVSFGGDVRHVVYEDADGDSLLSAVGAASRATIRVKTLFASGEREEQTMVVAAGADGNFKGRQNGGGVNPIVLLKKVTLLNLDTLLSLVLSDVDGDGFVYNPLRDSNLVGVERREGALTGRSELSYRMAVFADSTRNYTYRFRKVVRSTSGVLETEALGRNSLPDFHPGDTGTVSVRFTSLFDADSLASSEAKYSVQIPTVRGNAAGNKLLRVQREKTFKTGFFTSTRYQLDVDKPVAAGSFASKGALFLRADLRSGGWVQFDGTAGADIFGTVTDSDGRTGKVRFKADGSVKSASGF